jgi:pyrimidine-nucleoside phosphorylase
VTPSAVALIGRKRDGGALSAAEIGWLISAYLRNEVDDAQMAAFLMAGVIRGFNDDEAAALTEVLVETGRSIDLSILKGPTVDKHSTGGVGDVTTLIVAPMLAAAGCQVAKLSGRGLGHTGGTLDKLESIPGMRVDLSPEQVLRQVEQIGLAVAAAGPDLVPGDRRLYALRDVTGTVGDPALIASSVMSKKIAGGAAHILLDVKVGGGALVADLEQARTLAERCVTIGSAHGRRVGALLTQMDEPLAPAVGNALEVGAAVEVLRGDRRGPLHDLSVELAAATLRLIGHKEEEAVSKSAGVLASGEALEKFRELVSAQGGDPSCVDRPWDVLPSADVVVDWTPSPGVVQRIDARAIGELAGSLGAARRRLGEAIDPAVGLELLLRVGERSEDGQPVARIHAASRTDAEEAKDALEQAVTMGDEACEPLPLVLGSVGFDGEDHSARP